jgi:DNA-binding FadR family transcriptional regulator
VKDGDLVLLEQTLDEMRDASRGGNGTGHRDDRFAAAEADFHRALVRIAGNRFLASALEPLHQVIATARRRRAADRDPSVIVQHERIVAALRHRDGTAAAAAVDDYGRHLASWLRVTG